MSYKIPDDYIWTLCIELTTQEQELLQEGLISLRQKEVDSETKSILWNLSEKVSDNLN